MTSNPHIEIIEKAVYAKCPELMDLSFGCEVWNGYQSPDNPFHRCVFIKYLKGTKHIQTRCIAFWKEHFAEWGFSDKNDEDNKFIIYGHPIEISHILRTLGQENWWMNAEGYFLKRYWESHEIKPYIWSPYIEWKIICKYDLTKPLSDQLPSTLEWLANQLSNNNK